MTVTADTLALPPHADTAATLSVLKGHTTWIALAVAPEGITFAREKGRLGVEEFQDVIRRSDLNRPVNDVPRLTAMLAHSNLLVTARDISGHLIGVARSLTDFKLARSI